MAAVNVAGLTREAKTYDNVLRALPFFTLQAFCAAMRISLLDVKDEDVVINTRRKAGITGPYKAGASISYADELLSFFESGLKPELVVAKMRENITNYADKRILSNAGEVVDLVSKKHPLERVILESIVRSHAEDVVFSIFPAERDDSVDSPMTAFNGLYTKLDAYVTAGKVAKGMGNLTTTGVFMMPTTDTDYDAYERLVEFVGSAHPMLRSSQGGVPQLILSEGVIKCAREALRYKMRYHDRPTTVQLLEQLREDTFAPGLIFSSHEAIGSGSRLILQKVGNMQIGKNTGRSAQFVQVRDIFEDPNEVQFWLESAYDTRLLDIHAKKFMTNEQSNNALDLAGDYGNLGAVTVNLTPAAAVNAGAKWKLATDIRWKNSGSSAINVPSGEQKIVFSPAEGYKTPADAVVSVSAGKEVTKSQTYTA